MQTDVIIDTWLTLLCSHEALVVHHSYDISMRRVEKDDINWLYIYGGLGLGITEKVQL